MDRGARRRFGLGLVAAALGAPLLDLLVAADALAGDAGDRARGLRARLSAASLALRAGAIDQHAWREGAAAICAELEGEHLLRALRIERLVDRLGAAATRPRSVVIGPEDGDAPLPAARGIRHRIFTFSKGQAIVPHAHDNLVSLFVVLRGSFRARHYARLHDAPGHLVLRPTIDLRVEPGDQTSITDFHDNVHWFAATSDEALLYNLSVDAGVQARHPRRRAGRVYVDPEGARLADGSVRAPRSRRDALRAKYEAPG